MFDLSDPNCVAALAAWLKATGTTDLVIDTQFRAAGRLEENSATDARILWNAVEYIRRVADCNVVLLHHTGKDAARGGRGSSADFGAVDQLLELTRDRTAGTLDVKVAGRKDGPDGFTVTYKAPQSDEDGSPVLVPLSAADADKLKGNGERISQPAVGGALASMNCRGREHACTTYVLAEQMLRRQGRLPDDPLKAERAARSFANRLMERAAVDGSPICGYCDKDGEHRNAPWVWFLPASDETGGHSDE